MNTRFKLLLLLLSLFALPAEKVLACGQNTNSTCGSASTEKSCCNKTDEKATSSCGKKTDTCKQSHSGQKCPDNKSHGGCHCPCGTATSGSSGGLIAEFSSLFLSISSSCDETLRQAFYFAQHMPEDVYFAIWQPPQLGV